MRTSTPPITQPSPIPGPFPGPPARNKLRSPRSISTFADGRQVYGTPSSIIAASQSSLGLNPWNRGPSQYGPGLPSASASTSSIPGLLGQTPPSSLLNVRMQPSPQALFLWQIKIQGANNADARREVAKTASRAVLLKRPPSDHPTKPDRPPAVLTRPNKPPRRQHNRSVSDLGPQPTYPQVGTPFLNSIPEDTAAANVLNLTTPTTNFNYPTANHINTTTIPARSADPTLSNTHQPFGTYHAPGMATTSHTKYHGGGIYYDQPSKHTNEVYSGTQDSKYQSLATTPAPALCTVCNTSPQYVEPKTRKISPYCSDACRIAATAAASQPQPQQAECSYPGCTKPAVMYPVDHYWNYCSEAHERYSRKGCISCRQVDDSGTQLCKRCNETFKQRAPTIIPVPMDHDAFWHVVDKFSQSWADPTQCPIFQAARVYKIMLTPERRELYIGYRALR
ncbi:hypothetical protein BJ322DRAFT_837379 [Thelephora terrestris]|uniref:Uncharacterized protein n=1 Tax=Thelephora terrestris TaxID=56493 RepID=A0A9P6HFB3_9AGAM|nr:hypothetical protein BJ322DRAFT_837379 [Thelephora terrestris]